MKGKSQSEKSEERKEIQFADESLSGSMNSVVLPEYKNNANYFKFSGPSAAQPKKSILTNPTLKGLKSREDVRIY